MNRILIVLPLVLLLVLTPIGPAAHAQQSSAPAPDEKVKADVVKRVNNKKDRVKVRLLNGSEVKGRITGTSENGFTVTDEKTGGRTDVTYTDVLKLQGRGMSSTKKIALFGGIGVAAAFIIVVAVAIKTFDPFENGLFK